MILTLPSEETEVRGVAAQASHDHQVHQSVQTLIDHDTYSIRTWRTLKCKKIDSRSFKKNDKRRDGHGRDNSSVLTGLVA